ncbi:MAG: fibrobacter succinogenes major paralogous domain-containing protein [Dysgonamonadaceae bacterium]|jgi:uncharacterized protein (TIGR02145 family)|nr:fibrobacter succinogenes major paralogous domain-containing protein [Dysgonamonadaceae bacterium]
MKQKMIFLALTLFILNAASVNAQVNIGSDDDPHKGAVLDLSQTTNLGLLLPQVFLTNVSDWQLDGNTKKEGMLIYNTNDEVPDGNGKDIYVWTRNGWRPIGPVTLKRFELDKSLLFVNFNGKTGTITAQNFTGSDDKPFTGVTVTWSIAAGAVPDDVSISPVDNTLTVTSGNTAGSFTVRATAGGLTQDCTVTILDCSSVEDVESNAYYAALFGAAGCWMTQNLRTKTYADGGTILSLGANSDPASKFYNYPNRDEQIFIAHPEYGLLYTWAAASGRTDHTAGEANNPAQQQYQGICPTGWHLPSDYEWNQLEKEIAESTEGVYSTAGATTWESSYSTTSGVRGNHGRKMISTTAVNNELTNGTSNAKSDNGFDGLLVGNLLANVYESWGQSVSVWTSTSYNSGFAWRLYCGRELAGVVREPREKYNLRSVRCKKDNN